jgi:hypothetical protein
VPSAEDDDLVTVTALGRTELFFERPPMARVTAILLALLDVDLR